MQRKRRKVDEFVELIKFNIESAVIRMYPAERGEFFEKLMPWMNHCHYVALRDPRELFCEFDIDPNLVIKGEISRYRRPDNPDGR